MAVEAHHLLHAGGQKQLMTTYAGWAGGTGGLCFDARVSEVAVPSQQQGYQQPCVGVVPPSSVAAAAGPKMMMGRQYGQAAACAAESGVTSGCGALEVAAAPRNSKRKRTDDGQPPVGLGVGAAGVARQLQQQLVDVDRLVLQHTAKMWAELTEQRRRHARLVAAAVEAAAAKRLRAKDEEIARVGRLNWALEDRVKSLFVEAQVWRDLAHSNEAAANALRAELQNALDAQARCWGGAAAGADNEDAGSCCVGENYVGEEEVGTSRRGGGSCCSCRVCGEGAAEVLLLPCRHLCACAPCAAAAPACPACGGAKNGSVRVNFS